MTEARSVALHSGIEDLRGRFLCDRAGDDSRARAFAVQNHVHLAHGVLVGMRQKLLRDHDLGVCALGDNLGVALRVVHARDLAGQHRNLRALGKIDNRLRVQNALARAFALAVVLFDIRDLRIFLHIERVDTVVLGVAVAAVVDAAAGNDGHLGAFADEEVVIDHVVEAGLCQHNRNMHILVLRVGLDFDVDAVLVGLRDDFDVIRIVAVRLLPVGADVDRTGCVFACHIGDNL